MAKLVKVVKIQIKAGKATPAPPIGTALGPHGINLPGFCSQFNAASAKMGDTVIPVEVSIYDDKSFTFIMKTPPAAILIMQAINVPKGSGEPNKNKIGELDDKTLEAIAVQKMPDLNAKDLPGAKRIIAGTARSMGVKIKE